MRQVAPRQLGLAPPAPAMGWITRATSGRFAKPGRHRQRRSRNAAPCAAAASPYPVSTRKAFERADCGAEVAQERHACLQDVGDRPQGLGRLRSKRPRDRTDRACSSAGCRAGVCRPVEGCRRQRSSRRWPCRDRPGTWWPSTRSTAAPWSNGRTSMRRRRVVHDQRDAERSAHRRDLRDREHAQLRIGQRLGVPGAGPLVRWRARNASGSAGSTKRTSTPWSFIVLANRFQVPPYRSVEETMLSPAFTRFCTASALAAWPDATARAAAPPSSAATRFSSASAVGIHDAGVDVAQLLQREQARRVVGAVELEGRGLVDRHRHRAGARIAPPAGMDRPSCPDASPCPVTTAVASQPRPGRSTGAANASIMPARWCQTSSPPFPYQLERHEQHDQQPDPGHPADTVLKQPGDQAGGDGHQHHRHRQARQLARRCGRCEAPATANTLSRLIDRSASRICSIAAPSDFGAGARHRPGARCGRSSRYMRQHTHSSSTPPANISPITASSSSATRAKPDADHRCPGDAAQDRVPLLRVPAARPPPCPPPRHCPRRAPGR